MGKHPNTLNLTLNRRLLWWFLFFAITAAILAAGFPMEKNEIKVGDIAEDDIYYSGTQTSYLSDILTTKLKNNAASRVEEVYRIDGAVLEDFDNTLNRRITAIKTAKAEASLDEQAIITAIYQALGNEFSVEDSRAAASLSDSELADYARQIKEIVKAAMQGGVSAAEFTGVEKDIIKDIRAINYRSSISELLLELYSGCHLAANKEFDPVATASKLEELLSAVEPVAVIIRPGEKIVDKGMAVTDEQLEALTRIGLNQTGYGLLSLVGVLLFSAIIYTLLIMYISLFRPTTRGKQTNIVLIGVVFNLVLLICKLITLINISSRPELVPFVYYLMPLAAASMLLVVLQGRRIAIFVSLLLAFCLVVIAGNQSVYPVTILIGGIVAVFGVLDLTQRSGFALASFYISLSNTASIVAFGLLYGTPWGIIIIGIGLGLLSAVFSCILTLGLLPFFESIFRITTPMRLLELCNTNHPLLKQMITEAPGTYQHSILVGNLAEAAADVVGADGLLVRTAAYYHDVGKLKRPYFYIENQLPDDNPHDKMQPTLSALVIISHIKDGVEMLRSNRMPQEVIDIMEQHHGDSLLTVFYQKALDAAENHEAVRAEDFSYPGPKPQNKEAALLMLADSVQAAVQSLPEPTKATIEQKVKDVIRGKLDIGQLDESALTFRELNAISRSFVNTLSGVGHIRIEYPSEEKENDSRAQATK